MGSRRFFIRAAAALVLALAPVSVVLAASPADVARDYVKANKQSLGLTGSDVNEMSLASVVPSRHNGVTHVYFQQLHRGIPVHAGVLNVNVKADGTVLSACSVVRSRAAMAPASTGGNAVGARRAMAPSPVPSPSRCISAFFSAQILSTSSRPIAPERTRCSA